MRSSERPRRQGRLRRCSQLEQYLCYLDRVNNTLTRSGVSDMPVEKLEISENDDQTEKRTLQGGAKRVE